MGEKRTSKTSLLAILSILSKKAVAIVHFSATAIMRISPSRFFSFALKILLPVTLAAAIAMLLLLRARQTATPPAAPAVSISAQAGDLVIDFPASWIEIPGKLSRTYRSPRPGAGLLQLSAHPPLAPGTSAADAGRELDSLLDEMKTEMDFGKRLEISHFETGVGPLAFAKYRSPAHGILGFWLLASDTMIFATYVDGGPGTAEKDIEEAQRSFLNARREERQSQRGP
jgi:hypothetical protein